MYTKTLAPKTKTVLDHLAGNSFLDPFYLSGGTALALHLGHRESEDLDFFTKTDFDPVNLQAELEKIASLSSVALDKGTLNCYIDRVQLQFLHYPYSLLTKSTGWNQIQLSSIQDIACTKLLTISARGSKKDFIDMYFILQKYTLNELFELLKKKYPKTDYNQMHLLKSLVYFEDAEPQVMPRMHKEVLWQQVKATIIQTTKAYKLT